MLKHFIFCGPITAPAGARTAVPAVGINMRLLTKKLEKDCLELFEWEAGMTLDVRPPLDTYKPGDPDDFIK